MDSIQLERLYVLIDAQTTEFNKQMDKVNAKIDEVSNTTKVSTGKASKMFTRFGKMVAAAFIGSEINGFLKKLTELSSKSVEFKATTDAAMRALADTLTPVLETIIKYTAIAIYWITGLIRAMFNLKVETKDATKETKALAKTYAGFDELNVVNQPTTSPTATIEGLLKNTEQYIKAGEKFWAQFGDTIKFVGGVLATAFAAKTLKNISGFFVDLKPVKWLKKVSDGVKNFFKTSDALIDGVGGLDKALATYDKTAGVLAETTEKYNKALSFGAEFAEDYADDIDILGHKMGNLSKTVSQNQDEVLKAAGAYDKAKKEIGWFGNMVANVAMANGWSVGASLAVVLAGAFTAVAVAGAAVYYALQPNIKMIDEIGYGLSTATKDAVLPMVQAITDLETSVKFTNLKNLITNADVEYLKTKVDEITNEVLNKLKEERDAALINLLPLKDLLPDEDYKALLEATDKYFKDREAIIKKGQARITEIYTLAAKDQRQLTLEEQTEVLSLLQSFQDTVVDLYSENADDLKAIRSRLKNDLATLSDQEKVDLYNKALAAKDEMIRIAKEQYDGILLEAERMELAGKLGEGVYEKIKAAATDAKNKSIDEAEALVDGVKQELGEDFLGKINESTGKVLSNWDKFWKDMKKLYDKATKDMPIWNPYNLPNANSKDIPTYQYGSGSIPKYADGGFPSAGSLFVAGEAGAELIGSHAGKTTVMPLENTSFVSAMSDAVYGAVAAALNENSNSGSTIIQVDGMTLAKSVESNLNKLSLAKGGLDIAL